MTTVAPIEAGIGQIWLGKQSALGTVKPTTDTNWIVPRDIGSNLHAAVVDSSEGYVDGKRWSAPSIFRDTSGGQVGTINYQAQVETTGQAWAWQFGSDTVTGGSDPWTHTIDSNATGTVYLTARQKVGANVGPYRSVYIDSRSSKTVWDCSQSQNVAHLGIDLASLLAGQFALTDPAQAAATPDPINWTSVSGQCQINGVTLAEISGENVTADLAIAPFWGDSVSPAALVEGKPDGGLSRSLTTIVTATTLPILYNSIFGTQTPTGGTNVSPTPTFASMQTKYAFGANRDVTYVSPRVHLNLGDVAPAAKPDGGTIEMTFGGEALPSGATAALTVIVRNGDSTSYTA